MLLLSSRRVAVRLAAAAVAGGAVALQKEEDPYEVLGLSRSASAEEIRRSYKKRAAKAHPDRGGDPEEFKRIAKAYEILGDDDKRRQYDAGGLQPGGGFDFSQGSSGQGGGVDDAFRLFEEFFSRGGRDFFEAAPPEAQRRRYVRPRVVKLRLTLEDLYRGGDYDIAAPRTAACAACDGRGGNVATCSACGGRGYSMHEERYGNFIRRTRAPCAACHGAGATVTERCLKCRGRGVLSDPKHVVKVSLKPGAGGGDRYEFPKEGDALRLQDGTLVGHEDVVVVVEEKEHPELQRLGPDLLAAKRVPLIDALTRVTVDLPDVANKKRRLRIRIRSLPVAPDDVFKVPNAGMPLGDSLGRGDLYVRFIVDFPKHLPKKSSGQSTRGLLAQALGDPKALREEEEGQEEDDHHSPTTKKKKKKPWSFEDFFAGGPKHEDADDRLAARASKAEVDRLFDTHHDRQRR